MKMRNKYVRGAVAAVTAGCAVSLAACSASASPSGNADTSIVNSTGKAPTGVTLTMWHSTADTPALESLYASWEKESGDKINFVNVPAATFGFVIQSKWATGSRPDILEWQGNDADALSLNMPKNALDLSSLPFVKKEGALANLSGNADGHVYAATLGPLLNYGVYYNKSVFAKAGLQPPKDYADLASDCKVLKTRDSGVTPIYEAGGSSFPPQALAAFNYMAQYNVNGSYGTAVVKGTDKLSDASGPFVAALKAYDSLRTSGCFNSDASTATWPQQTQAVLNGQAAMMAEDSNSIAQMVSQANNNASEVAAKVGFVAVSATKPIANTSPNPVGTYYVPKTGNTTKERAAIDFIKFVTSSTAYQKYVNDAGIIPTLSGTTTPPLTGLWKEVQAATKGTTGLTLNSSIPGFGNQFGNESDKLLAGQETPQQLASKMQTYVEQAIQAESS